MFSIVRLFVLFQIKRFNCDIPIYYAEKRNLSSQNNIE